MPEAAHRYFEALHKNLEEQYKPRDCPTCQSLQVELAKKETGEKNFFRGVGEDFKNC